MRFEKGIDEKYQRSIEDAFATILAKGNDHHKAVIGAILESQLLVRVRPVSEVNASGVTGVINPVMTNIRLKRERMSLIDALGEIYITIAKETIDTGGQQGCEGTFVHEGQHAYDFAQTLESLSNADMNPLGVLNPTLYEMELAAHKSAGDYMLCIDREPYLDEGLQLMILCREDGKCEVDPTGIDRRLRESYGLELNGNQGSLATEMMGIVV